jgi:mRNA deadenylase 3'-5' endonuclease subunit Ccr4
VDHYQDFLLPLLEARGYSGEFLKRRGDRLDGCAMFWRRSKLQRVASAPLHLDVSAFFDRPNVCQILEFRTVEGAHGVNGAPGK